MTPSRRTLLKAVAGSAAAAVTACATTEARPDAGAARRVVVVGAGLAGLVAAASLRDAGWDVVVVEARERLGGRVHTLGRDGSFGSGASQPLIAEGGGESIDDRHDRLRWWISELGLRTTSRLADRETSALIDAAGLRTSGAELLGVDGGRVAADYERAYAAIENLAGDEDPTQPAGWRDAERLDAQDVASFLDSLSLHPLARFAVDSDLRSSYNCELGDLSLLLLAAQEAFETGDEETMRVAGGNSAVVDALATRVGHSRIRRGAPVRSVRRRGGVYAVDAGGRTIWANRVVIAAPPVPVRRIRFDPALPAGLAAAVAGLDLGTTVKVVTRYDRRVWTAEGFSGLTVTDRDYRIAWDATDNVVGDGRPRVDEPALLTTFTSGDPGAAFGAMSPADRVAAVARQLDATYAGDHEARTGTTATVAWANERYTGGGYAFWRPGQVLTMSDVWRRPVRSGSDAGIWFAGEHTEPLVGYMESAVRSGERVARSIGRA
ncbi:MAG: NAD(P)/FAD-dependent oxidoreductase [Acidimicrobiales bacterium]